jgi:hypothetical protein
VTGEEVSIPSKNPELVLPNPKRENTIAPINMANRKIIEFFIYNTSGKKNNKVLY